jgi:hypothetical protein
MDSRFRGNDEWVRRPRRRPGPNRPRLTRNRRNFDPGLRRDDTNIVAPAQAGAQFHTAAITRERISA